MRSLLASDLPAAQEADPGFIDYVCNKKFDIVRVYLPPDGGFALNA